MVHISELTKEAQKYHIEAGWVDDDGNVLSCCGLLVRDDGRCPKCKENCV